MTYRYAAMGVWIIFLTLSAGRAGALAQDYSPETGYVSVQDDDARTITSSGEAFDPSSMVAAHPFLPFDTMVRVTRLDTGSSIVVRINDRPVMPSESVLVLSTAAASRLHIDHPEDVHVRIEPLSPHPLVFVETRLAGTDQEIVDRRSVERNGVDRKGVSGKTVSQTESIFTLQIGVFSTERAARTFAGSIEKSWISAVPNGIQGRYRVYFRRFEAEEDARLAQRLLRESGHPSFLRRIAP